MSALSHIFGGDVSAEHGTAPVKVDGDWGRMHARTAPASAAAAARTNDEVARLQLLVGSRAGAVDVGAPPAVTPRMRRARGARDVLTGILVFVAAIAVIVAAATATLVLSQRSPEGDALHALSQVETVLQSQITGVNSSVAKLTSDRDDQVAVARALQKPLAAALTGLDDGTVDAQALDAGALKAAQKARAAYQSALTDLSVPGAVDPYTPASVDKSSLASIGAAIDRANAAVAAGQSTSDDVVAARDALAGLQGTFLSAMRTLAASVTDAATAVTANNPDAAQASRDAVSNAAGDVAALSADSLGDLAKTLPAYSTAVVALQDDQSQVLAQAAAAEAARQAAARQAAARQEAARQAAEKAAADSSTSNAGSGDTSGDTSPKGSGGKPSKGSGTTPPKGSGTVTTP